MMRIPWWAVGGALLAIGAAALTVHLVAASGTAARSGRLLVHSGRVEPPGLEVSGDVVAERGGAARQLAAPAAAPLVGSGLPVAAASPDRTLLAYNTFRWNRTIDWTKSLAEQGVSTGDPLGIPRIHLRSLRRSRDWELEPGSQSLAWRRDGALAYVVGAPPHYRANLPFQGNVVVRASAEAAPVSWTLDPGPHAVLAWAGPTLLVRRDAIDSTPDVLALDGPGRVRTLAAHATFLAVSPDGADALVADAPAETQTPQLRILRVSDGAAIATLYLADARDPVTGEPTAWVSGPAAWRDDRAVVASSTGLLVLRAAEALSVEQVLHLDSATRPNGQLFEPRFAGDGTDEIVAWSGIPGTLPVRAAQIVCDRIALTCTRGRPVAPAATPRPVYDLSGGKR